MNDAGSSSVPSSSKNAAVLGVREDFRADAGRERPAGEGVRVAFFLPVDVRSTLRVEVPMMVRSLSVEKIDRI